MPITITEALAEIKTIGKRLTKKREMILQNIIRADHLRDPFAKEGGSVEILRREMQSVHDLEARMLALRVAINTANTKEVITIKDHSHTIAEWLIWRREVLPEYHHFQRQLVQTIVTARTKAAAVGGSVLSPGTSGEGQKQDIVVNVDEKNLLSELEQTEEILGTLDGQLSVKNATVILDI